MPVIAWFIVGFSGPCHREIVFNSAKINDCVTIAWCQTMLRPNVRVNMSVLFKAAENGIQSFYIMIQRILRQISPLMSNPPMIRLIAVAQAPLVQVFICQLCRSWWMVWRHIVYWTTDLPTHLSQRPCQTVSISRALVMCITWEPLTVLNAWIPKL